MKFTLYADTQTKSCIRFILNQWQQASRDKKPLEVTIKPKEDKRKVIQNARYWTMLNDFTRYAVEAGMSHSAEAYHEAFKRVYIGVIELPNGDVMGKSSTDLNVQDFAEFSNKVEAHLGSEYGFIFYERGEK